MKRLLSVLICVLLALPAMAQLRFGVIGGASFCGSDAVDAKSVTRYHAGLEPASQAGDGGMGHLPRRFPRRHQHHPAGEAALFQRPPDRLVRLDCPDSLVNDLPRILSQLLFHGIAAFLSVCF